MDRQEFFYCDDSFEEKPTFDPRAITYWGDPSLALFMEASPDSPITLTARQTLREMAYNDQPLLSEYGFPDFRAVREQLGLSIVDVAQLWGEDDDTDIIWSIEYGFRDLTLSAALGCCRALKIPLGALFHDCDFKPRPMTRIRKDEAAGNIIGFWI